MITLTEKRLKELENRIPIYEAMIAELKKKLDAVNAFPEDIESVKELFLMLDEKLQAYGEQQQKDKMMLAGQLKDIDDSRMAHWKAIQGVKTVQENINSSVEGHNVGFQRIKEKSDKLEASVLGLHVIAKGLDDRSLQDASEIESIKSSLLYHQSRSNTIQADAIAALAKTKEHDSKIENHQKDIEGIIDAGKNHGRVIGDLKNRLDTIPKPIQAKSYDAEIADIRKNIAIVMKEVAASAAKVPDQTQITAKVKELEKAIAELYGLLKPYANR